MDKSLIIGSGSIGKRHYEILKELSEEVEIYSRRENKYNSLVDCLKSFKPTYVVVATETSSHYEITNQVVENNIPLILIEKPIFHNSNLKFNIKNSIIKVGYNMRFNPLLRLLKEKIHNQKIISAQVYTGQFLPLWRPQQNYKKSYSVDINQGGGVLNDLSHEFDYLQWLFGSCEFLFAQGGHFSNLYGNSDDVFALIMSFENCKVINVQLNYLHQPIKRELIVNTSNNTFQIDFPKKEFYENGTKLKINDYNRDFAYIEQHIDMIENKGRNLCSLSEGINILKLIEIARISSKKYKWMKIIN